MAADSPAELMLKRLLLHNKLITQRQVERVVETSVGRSKRTLPDEILHRRLVKPELMLKIVESITKKGGVFPPLSEDVDGTIESGTKPARRGGTQVVDTAKPAASPAKSGAFPAVAAPGKVVDTAKPAAKPAAPAALAHG